MMVLYLSLLLLASAIATAETGKPLRPGDPLPPLRGEYLSGRKASLPEDSRGKWALLAIGFSYDSRFAVERWSKEFQKASQGRRNVTFYEIPMIGGMARMGKWFIDSGMRSGTPKELHENVITVYGGTSPWKKAVAFQKDDHAYLIWIGPDGVIRWVWNGLWDEQAFKAFQQEFNKTKD